MDRANPGRMFHLSHMDVVTGIGKLTSGEDVYTYKADK